MKAPQTRVLYTQKAGNEAHEWEDGAAYDSARGSFAVADGASSSFRAARWSSALTTSFIAECPDLEPGLVGFESWVGTVAERYQDDSIATSAGSWYASDASRRGSFATFVGLQLGAADPLAYRAVVVGDACLFHCRGGQLVAASVHDPDSFGSTPDLLGSSKYRDGFGTDNARYFESSAELGDVLFLTTDAIGEAMLRLQHANDNVWSFFAEVPPHQFTSVITALRGVDAIENDDVTLMRIATSGMAT